MTHATDSAPSAAIRSSIAAWMGGRGCTGADRDSQRSQADAGGQRDGRCAQTKTRHVSPQLVPFTDTLHDGQLVSGGHDGLDAGLLVNPLSHDEPAPRFARHRTKTHMDSLRLRTHRAELACGGARVVPPSTRRRFSSHLALGRRARIERRHSMRATPVAAGTIVTWRAGSESVSAGGRTWRHSFHHLTLRKVAVAGGLAPLQGRGGRLSAGRPRPARWTACR